MDKHLLRGGVFFSAFLPSFTRLGYDARRWCWAPDDFDFTGQHWLVSGASNGIGRAIVAAASQGGARVTAIARNEAALGALKRQHPGVEPLVGDLSLMTEVDRLVQRIDAPVDVLVNNVGVMFNQPQRTAEGLDAGFAINVLGHHRLTRRLHAQRALRADVTVVHMSSGGMYNVALDVAALQGNDPYDGTLTYAFHKRAQVALNGYWQTLLGDQARSYVMHPGWVKTVGVATAMPEFNRALAPILRPPEAGADTALWLAARRPTQVKPGIWFDRKLRPEHVFPGTRRGDSVERLIAELARCEDVPAASGVASGAESHFDLQDDPEGGPEGEPERRVV